MEASRAATRKRERAEASRAATQKIPSLDVVEDLEELYGEERVAMLREEWENALLERAREAYERGTLDEEYLQIALEMGVDPHDAYSAAFGYLPSGGKAA